MNALSCFKAYDIRGKLGEELNDAIAYRIGRAFAAWLKKTSESDAALTVVVGGDVRLTSSALKLSLSNGLMDMGVNVIDLGMTGTEEIYFATFHLGVAGGIEVTASHNPIDYNGMKLVQAGAKPLDSQDFAALRQLAEANMFYGAMTKGRLTRGDLLDAYTSHLLTYIQPARIQPLKLVVNAGNGAAGHVIDALEQVFANLNMPVGFIKVHHEANGQFPHGIPNPLLPECRADTAKAVLDYQADMGIAWDGDFDRCFLFDENGEFIEGYYIVGLLAEAFLQRHPGASIVHDPRLTWNTLDVVTQAGGKAIQSKTGHAFIKETMRAEDAVYGGEMSAHHYFRDFAYCDSGMIPWLLVAELMSVKQQPLSQLVAERIAKYPCSGELNFTVSDVALCLERVQQHFSSTHEVDGNPLVDLTDGLSMTFADWRFNLRGSNTEPVLRLNVESRGNMERVTQKTEEVNALLS